jgi:hypothetical protein
MEVLHPSLEFIEEFIKDHAPLPQPAGALYLKNHSQKSWV